MGWLSTIGKIAGIAGAPFTGGLSLIPAAVSAAGDVASSIEKGRSAERAQTNQLNQQDDLMALKRQQMAEDQARSNFNVAPNLYSRAMLGDVTANMQPLAYGPDGKLTGGISSSLFT